MSIPAEPPRVLLVEDDSEIAALISQALAERGFVCRAVACSTEMDEYLGREGADLILLDLMLPGEDGIGICRRLRGLSNRPIVMLTASDEDIDRILALELGADDYITKPFNPRELAARLRTILRRCGSADPTEPRRPRSYGFAGWTLDAGRRLLSDPDGIGIALTSAEFDVIFALCLNAGRVLSREQLLELTYGGAAGPVERTVDVHVSRIRQKIEPDPRQPTLIKTVRLGGYLFTPTVVAR